MQFDVVVPTRGNVNILKKFLSCIALQTLQPQRIIFVVNGFEGTVLQLQGEVSKDLSPDLYKRVERHIIPLSSPHTNNASYARNVGRSIAQSEYIYFLDDDNEFAYDFFARTVAEYLKYKQEYKQDLVYSPTIMRRDSGRIQSLGIKSYHFHIGRPEPVIFDGWKNKLVTKLRFLFPISSLYVSTFDYCRVVTIGGNSLFSKKSIFATHQFDQHMAFVYEDIDCLYRITKHNIPLIVSKKVTIQHMERDKTKLEKSFLAYPATAYQKSKNRILFIKKNAAVGKKLVFFICGLPITSFMISIFIIGAGGKRRFATLLSYRLGILHGLKQ